MNTQHYFKLLILFLIIGLAGCTPEQTVEKESIQNDMFFTTITSDHSGITFKNKVNESAYRNSMFFDYFLNGSGVAVGDINNDGLADIFFTGNDTENKLYLNTSDFTFKDISESAIPNNNGWCTGVNMIDINNDGFLDIFVCRSGMVEEDEALVNQLLINNGDLTFTDATESYGLTQANQSIHSSFFDYDNDGDLDLWVNNHVNFDGDVKAIFDNAELPHEERIKFRSALYENVDNKFVDVSVSSGISRESASLGVATLDFNGDGWLDIYISNDYDIPDYYFMNNGDKTFTEVSKEKVGHTSFYSMGLDAADINNDLLLDMVAVDMTPQDHVRNKVLMASMDSKKFQYLYDFKGLTKSYMYNTVQVGRGDGTFSEVGNYMGVSQTEWSWAPLIADFDNDGHKDLYITNGYLRDTKDNDFKNKVDAYRKENGGKWNEDVFAYFQEIINSTPVDNRIFKNKDGKYKNVTGMWSDLSPTFSNGAAYGDFDNDGDLDLVINNIDQEASVLRNDISNNNYVQIVLDGGKSGKSTMNAELYLYSKGQIQRSDYSFSKGYQSSVQHRIHFGLGQDEEVDKIEVQWPDGQKVSFTGVEVNSLNTLEYGSGTPLAKGKSTKTAELFEEVTSTVLSESVQHQEYKFDDFKKEILLPHKYSDLGPALAVGDIDGDGLEDLFLGGSNTSESILLTNKNSVFTIKNDNALLFDKKYEDLGALFFDYDGDGHLDLYVASGGGGEIEEFPELTQDRLYKNDGSGNFMSKTDVLPPISSSTKSIVALDADQDGDLDLIVGGRNSPGKYPTDARSYYLENSNGIFRDRTQRKIKGLPGMITDIEVEDIDKNGWPDLIVTGEWTAPMFFMNEKGEFTKKEISALASNNGWWQSIQKADLDNDGDIDFVLGNMGENSKFHPSSEKPLGVLASDFDKSGSLDIVLTKKYNDKTVPVRGKECSSEQMPMLKEKFDTYRGFATSSIEDILGEENIKEAYSRSVSDFSSYILLNEGDFNFSIQKLPPEAQWFPISDIIVSDFNTDGNMDLFLVGNKINSEPETPSYDAGRGLILLGDGNLNFEPLNSIKQTGVNAKYDARSAQLVQISPNKKLVVVANNDGPLQFFSRIE
ncbi:MAG: VCBS repeat-containing protein [Saprospiraceae bacterium]|nr:VCBS repeat-containing protein [Saprospiraceae bacterium]